MSQADQEEPTGELSTDTPAVTDDVNAAESSAADQGEKSFEDVVMAALEQEEEPPASTDEPGDDDAKAADETPEENDAENESTSEEEKDETSLTEAEMAALNEKTRDRIHTLLDDRKSLRTEKEELATEIEQLKPAADSYRQVQEFMRDNGLSAQDAGAALRLAGQIQTDPRAAYEALKPIMEQLAGLSGETLPTDLAEEVKLGRITQERAQELGRARADQKLTEQRSQEQEAERQRQGRVAHAQQMSQVGDQLASERMQSDPDWKLKEPLVVDKLRVDISENGMPKDEAELRTRFDKAVTDVTTYLKNFQTAPKPVAKPAESVSSPEPKPKAPTSGVDAVMQALGD